MGKLEMVEHGGSGAADRNGPVLELESRVLLCETAADAPAGAIGIVVGYYATEREDIEYAVSFPDQDLLLRLPLNLLESLDD